VPKKAASIAMLERQLWRGRAGGLESVNSFKDAGSDPFGGPKRADLARRLLSQGWKVSTLWRPRSGGSKERMLG